MGGPCPGGRRCRYGDTAFVRFDEGVRGQRGLIARPAFFGPTDALASPYTVRGSIPFGLCGWGAAKVGRTTGFSSGEIIDSCEDVQVRDSNFTMLCQDRVDADSAKGDSGSPVFTAPGGGDAFLLGSLWGGNDDGEFSYSPVGPAHTQRGTELGAMQVIFGNDPPTVDIVAPQNGAAVSTNALDATRFVASVTDFERGENCCTVTWSSNLDGHLGTGLEVTHSFLSPGPRTITVRADDGINPPVFDSIVVHGTNDPPGVSILSPEPTDAIHPGLVNVFQADSFDSERFAPLPCTSLTWTSSNPADPFPMVGCSIQVTFPTLGPRTLRVVGVDNVGAQGTDEVTIQVTPEPSNGPPTVRILAPDNDSGAGVNSSVQLVGTANDPDDKSPIQYQWILHRQNSQTVLANQSGLDESQTTVSWTPSDTASFSCGGEDVQIELVATDADGDVGRDIIEFSVTSSPC